MAHQEKTHKHKKGFMMSFYKFSTSKELHKSQLKSHPIPSTTKPSSKIDQMSADQLQKTGYAIALPRRSKDIEEVGCRNEEISAAGGRKSVSHVEISNVASVAAFLSVKILAADMPGFMQARALRCARKTYDSLEKFSSKHLAFNLKKEFDEEYGPAWHCIVGSSFGSFVTHSTGCFLYFSMDKIYVLIFRTKVRRA